MTDVAMALLAVLASCVSLEVYVAIRAPLGYQDEQGFHLGIEAQTRAEPDSSEQPA